ncbi:TIGR04222 domain-containing membrane protein [Streptomyces hydrogenans]|uniref:TIGR04222 domain-containing membrane protein n=1 Tax=Streptomyces hydrogenans TaxID=1873719 RepID=UPI00380C1D56
MRLVLPPGNQTSHPGLSVHVTSWLAFGGYCVAVLWAGWSAWRVRAAVANPPVPERELDVYELGYLRGRETGAVAASVGLLLMREALLARESGIAINRITVRNGDIVAPEPLADTQLRPLDRSVMAAARAHQQAPRGRWDVQPGQSIHSLTEMRPVRAELARIRDALDRDGLLDGPAARARFRRGLLPLRILIGVGAVAAFTIGLDNPIPLLLVTTVAAVTSVVFTPPSVKTSGRLVRQAAERHPAYRPQPNPSGDSNDADAFARGIALHGISVLHNRYPQLTPPPPTRQVRRRASSSGSGGGWLGDDESGAGCGSGGD